MGKATILENIGAGRYRIKVHFDNAQVDAMLAYNESIIGILATQITENGAIKAAAWSEYQYHLSYLTDFITSAGSAAIVDQQDEVHRAMGTVTQKKAAYDAAAYAEVLSKLRLEEANKDIAYLTKYCPKEIESYAWCVAYNEDLTGDLASIEVDYALHRDLYTQQIHDHTGFWLLDGQIAPTTILQHPLSTSEHATWFNLCMLPAAQRHKGLYRIATIIRIDYELNQCDIYFDSRYNVDRYTSELLDEEPIVPRFDLYGSQQIEYRGAEVEYMGGGAETFLVGDKVIVDLHAGVGVPTVIGYYENPREGYLMKVHASDDYPYYRNSNEDWADFYRYHFLLKETSAFNVNAPNYIVSINGSLGNYRFSSNTHIWEGVGDGFNFFVQLKSNDFQEVLSGYNDMFLSINSSFSTHNFAILLNGILIGETEIAMPGAPIESDYDPHAPIYTVFTNITNKLFGNNLDSPFSEYISIINGT